MTDIAKKKSRTVTIDGNRYRIKPASRNVLRALKEIDVPDPNDGETDMEGWMEAMIEALDLRLVPMSADAPSAREVLLDLWGDRELIGPEEINDLAGELSSREAEDRPPR